MKKLLTPEDAGALAVNVAETHGLDLEEMLSTSRRAECVDARLEIYRELRKAGWSYPRIGKFVGRDHTTIMHALDAGATRRGATPWAERARGSR